MADIRRVCQMMGMGMMLAALAGCGTSVPSRYYTLTPMADAGGPGAKPGPCISLKVGPVVLPKYLARNQIVTRPTPNTLDLAKFDQWAEPLEDNFLRVFTENLYTLLCVDRLAMFPRESLMPVDYQVIVDVIRFDGSPDGDVTLTARWAVLGKSPKNVLATDKSTFVEPAGAPGYASMAAAGSRLVLKLSQEIATAIEPMIGLK